MKNRNKKKISRKDPLRTLKHDYSQTIPEWQRWYEDERAKRKQIK